MNAFPITDRFSVYFSKQFITRICGDISVVKIIHRAHAEWHSTATG